MHLFLREIPVCYMYFPKCSCNTKNQIDKNEEHMYYLIKYEESVENRVAGKSAWQAKDVMWSF